MSTLKITFQNGDTAETPFASTSTVTVMWDETVDGEQDRKTMTWSEIVGLEIVDEKPRAPRKPAAEK